MCPAGVSISATFRVDAHSGAYDATFSFLQNSAKKRNYFEV
jgi:hypothetical protein